MKADGKKKNASKGGNKQFISLQAQEGQALTSSLSGQSQNTAEASVPAEQLTYHEELCNLIVRLQYQHRFCLVVASHCLQYEGHFPPLESCVSTTTDTYVLAKEVDWMPAFAQPCNVLNLHEQQLLNTTTCQLCMSISPYILDSVQRVTVDHHSASSATSKALSSHHFDISGI